MLTIVTALPWEAARFAARLRGPRRVDFGEGWAVWGEREGVSLRVAVSGPGRKRVERALDDLGALDPPATGLLTVGVAGGLEQSLRPGAVVISPRLHYWNSAGRRERHPIRADGGFLRFVEQALDQSRVARQVGDSLTVDAPLLSTQAKADHGRSSGAAVVQMEDYHWAEGAARLSIPSVPLRVVLDPVGSNLPAAVAAWDWRGPRADAIARAVMRQPSLLVALARLAWQRRAAVAAIDRALEALVVAGKGSARG